MTSQKLRKTRSEQELIRINVPVNEHLPYVEAEPDVLIRSKVEIINRIIPLTITAAKALEAPDEYLAEAVEDYQANKLFTNEERQFMESEITNEQAKINFSWKLESIWVLLWSVGLVPELNSPDKTCDVDLLLDVVLNSSRDDLLNKATVKEKSIILDELDFIYRAHWAVRNAQLHGTDIPAALDEGVVYERHYAFNWLVHYMDQEWEEISTDT
ncbi:DUF4272 domain-containing protein [Niallia circulans]|uniref:DUF4272 domain-containing protein n=1 Tax=Niallia circulans TaxID=1397 RepID=A0A553SMG0_NIACI|nr:DUF4272 domain-containing protein [Niallia circulans]TRZ38157.1 DUF4272 domain-containing protein [Niallia circulans]